MQNQNKRPRRVFVTGAGHGIGRAIVEAFTKEGDRVALRSVEGRHMVVDTCARGVARAISYHG